MSRLTLPTLFLLTLPAVSTAQPISPPRAGFGSMRQPPPGAPFPPVGAVPLRYPGGIFGGFIPPGYTGPGFPFSGVWGGYGYGYVPWFPFYNFSPTPLYADPFRVQVPMNTFPTEPARPPEPVVALANEFPARLTLEFPAAAEVWVNGKKRDESPSTEWTLTSPVLKSGESYTFEVKARWTAGGKTYEAERSVPVASGNRSRVLVVAGTQVRE